MVNVDPDELLADMPRGVATRYLRHQTLPQARWQSPDAILGASELQYDPKAPAGKILVGAIGSQLVGIADNRHVMTIAGSRAGKSVTIIGNLLFYRGSVLATDPKAELAARTAAARAALGQHVYVLDPFEYASSEIAAFRARYNPMATLALESPTIIEDASLIADAIVVQAHSAKDPHWDESAKILIEGVMLHVASGEEFEGERDLITVRRLIRNAMEVERDSNGAYYVLERAMRENAARLSSNSTLVDLGHVIDGAALDFFEKSDKERDSVLSTARRHTKFLDYTAMRRVLTGHDFDLKDLKRAPEGVTIYLCFPATRADISNRWLRIFVNQLLDAMEREQTVPEDPVLACLDEFPVLGYMRQLETAAGQIASYHVKLWVVLQDWGQGKALYGERWETFAANAGVLQFFGNSDLASSEYLSRKLGKTRIDVTRQGEVSPESRQAGLDGASTQAQVQDLMAAEEIGRYFSRDDALKRQAVLWAGYHPMVLQRVAYFDRNGPLAPYIATA